MPFEVFEASLAGVKVLKPRFFGDERGEFAELYKETDFKESGVDTPIVQVNYSKSKKGVLRGMHYQIEPHAQGKVVGVVAGEVFDVAVDLRKGSESFGKWFGKTLNIENKEMMWIPPGFAHGFLALSDDSEVVYFCTGAVYNNDAERGVLWNDADINIEWPESEPILADRDGAFPELKDAVDLF